jgi:4a-hydroxytetrahydrobiopterin dehydratase
MTIEQCEAALVSLPGWSMARDGTAIARNFRFKDFEAAFGFMRAIAAEAERMDHHPEWLNVYNKVDVVLSTHSEGGVTEKDIALAQAMNAAAGES